MTNGNPLVPAIRALVDAAPDATAVVDPELRLLHFNRAYVDLTGLRGRELRERAPAGMCHEHFRIEACAEPQGCIALRALRAGRPVRVDEVRARDGERRFNVIAVPLAGPEGTPNAVVETYRDVTAESRMQARYKDLLDLERRQNEILQAEVRQRTADLSRSLEDLKAARTQLIHSEKMSSLGQLVAGIAHELNNPVNFIYANVDFLEANFKTLMGLVDRAFALDLPADARADLERVAREAEIDYLRQDLPKIIAAVRSGGSRAAAIVRDLRAFSHAGPTEMALSDLNEGIETTLRLAAPQAKGRVRIVTELGELPAVRCNLAHINQVVMNLVVNALQAIAGNGTVTVRSRAEPNGTVVFEVEDDGSGIPPEIRGKIFDPFFTTKEVGQGTGLGLSISFGIVRAHDGSIDVESEVGRGTTFRVTLPVGGSRA